MSSTDPSAQPQKRSVFNQGKSPSEIPSHLSREIGAEVAHLYKKDSHSGKDRSRVWIGLLVTCVIGVFGCLFCMDPFIYAHQKTHAIQAYVYLNTNGVQSKARALADSGMFTSQEIFQMNHASIVPGVFDSLESASNAADEVLGYLQDVNNLHAKKYSALQPLGQLRCMLFVEIGLSPPTQWDQLNPVVGQDGTVVAQNADGSSSISSSEKQVSGAMGSMSAVTQALQNQNGK